MSSCSSYALNGLAKSCDPSKGGITDIYIANFDTVSAVTANSGEVITAITMSGSTKFYHYHIRKGSCTLTETLNVDSANGTNYVSSELSLQFTRMEAEKRLEMKALALNELAILVKDANGKIWFLGEENPVMANGGASQTGQAVGDGNFYQITFTDESSTYPREVDADALTSIVAEANAS